MDRRGPDLWKRDMEGIRRSMASARERDIATRDGLDALCETVREFAERASALDSAVWRTTSRGGARVEGGGASHALGIIDRRVRCGSDVIVRGVIPFLENEPVEEAIRKMVDSGY